MYPFERAADLLGWRPPVTTWSDVARETGLARTRRARRMARLLAAEYPDARCELDFENPLQLLVATVLSAQCTDRRVNIVTPALFSAYPDAVDYASARAEDVERIIHSTGFFRAKAANIIGIGRELCDRFGGEVPNRMEDLVSLPGVGRKTANVVLGNAFDIPGLTVDTHFGRLVRRFGWTAEEDPVKVERAVGDLIPRASWTSVSHQLIWHGRRVCRARTPACGECVLAHLCPSARV